MGVGCTAGRQSAPFSRKPMAEVDVFITAKALHFTEGGVARIMWPGTVYRLERGEAQSIVARNLGWLVDNGEENDSGPEPEPKQELKSRGSNGARKRARDRTRAKKCT